jgi:hypothetical protein
MSPIRLSAAAFWACAKPVSIFDRQAGVIRLGSRRCGPGRGPHRRDVVTGAGNLS